MTNNQKAESIMRDALKLIAELEVDVRVLHVCYCADGSTSEISIGHPESLLVFENVSLDGVAVHP